jgi:disulfide bond formation protein DsbB
VTDEVTFVLAALAVVGQGVVALLPLLGALRLAGFAGPLEVVRSVLWGYELWLAFAVTAVATGGSLFYSEVAGFPPCELCWFQRIFMYPLAIVTLIAAATSEHRVARLLLPLPVLGAGFSSYHLLVENGIVEQTSGCAISAPGGCATRWVEELGYITIPTLALTAFALAFAFLLLASFESRPGTFDRS